MYHNNHCEERGFVLVRLTMIIAVINNCKSKIKMVVNANIFYGMSEMANDN